MVKSSRLSNRELGITRPPSSYVLFMQDKYKQYNTLQSKKRLRHKTSTWKPSSKSVSHAWHSMSEAEQAPYVERFKQLTKGKAEERKRALKLAKAEMAAPSQRKLDPTAQKHFMQWGLDMLQMGDTIGTGTYGYGKMVTSTMTGLRFACKFGNKADLSEEEEAVAANLDIIEEKAYLRMASHPGILQCHGLVTHNEQVGLVLELGHSSLMGYLKAFQLPKHPSASIIQHRKKFFLQAAVALHHCHSMAVMHLDVKPNNMILCTAPCNSEDQHPGDDRLSGMVLKLSDFGLAQKFAKDLGTLHVIPTHVYNKLYRPPECDTNEKKVFAQKSVCCAHFLFPFLDVSFKIKRWCYN